MNNFYSNETTFEYARVCMSSCCCMYVTSIPSIENLESFHFILNVNDSITMNKLHIRNDNEKNSW